MSEGHTPGPWRLWLSEHDRGAFMLNGDSPERHGADMVIVQRHIGTPNGDEGIANARLIAAAPDLLAALKALLSFDDVTRANDRGPAEEGWQSTELQHAFGAAEAAIAKAEGKDQR